MSALAAAGGRPGRQSGEGARGRRRAGAGRALYSAGFLAWRQGDAAAARPLLEASVSLARSGRPTTAYALFYLGLVPQFQGDYPAARASSRRAGPCSRRPATSRGWPWPCSGWGTWPARKGTAPARTLLERSLDLFREEGDRRSLALPWATSAGWPCARATP